jgi:ABC-type antimicrobial peptide transport system permease subunit
MRRFVLRLLNVFRRDTAEQSLAREIASHLALLDEEYQRRGMTPADARRAARLALGGVERVKDSHRDARSFVWLDDVKRDVVHAARLVRRNPVFALTATLSLAIGIGANTAIFTVANALLFRGPVGVAEPERLVDIGTRRDGNAGMDPTSYPVYLDIRERTTTLAGVYAQQLFPHAMSLEAGSTNASAQAVARTDVSADPRAGAQADVRAGVPAAAQAGARPDVPADADADASARAGAASGTSATGGGGAERVFGHFVTTNYFTVLGATPSAGRMFDRRDSEQPGASPVAVLSHGFWTRRFNQNPAIVGQTIKLNGQTFAIVGIAVERFQGTGLLGVDVWLPLNMTATGSAPASSLADRGDASVMVGARLKPGASVAQAAADVEALGGTLGREYPTATGARRGLRLLPSSRSPGNGGVIAAFLTFLMVIVGLVLIVACANVAGILLARSAARRREIAVRLAIGAGRARLVRQLLTETVMLFALGGFAGLLLARAMTSLLVPLLPSLPFPITVGLALDGRVIAFTAGLSLVAALLSGLAPALQASKAEVVTSLKSDSQGPSARSRLRHAFVIAQIAISIVLVIVAGLFVRALQRAGSTDPGFDPHGVELASLDLSMGHYTDVTGARFARDLVERVRQLPGVEAATIASVVPGGLEGLSLGGITSAGFAPADGRRFRYPAWNIVEPGYFATMRMRLIAGRDFSARDLAGAQPVIILSDALARQLWPGQDAVGKYVSLESHAGGAARSDAAAATNGAGATGATGGAARSNAAAVPNNAGATGATGGAGAGAGAGAAAAAAAAAAGSAATAPAPLLVVGVARDIKTSSLVDGLAEPFVYIPFQQRYTERRANLTIAARGTRGQRLTEELRTLVRTMDPNLPIVTAQTLEDSTALGFVTQRIVASISGSLGGVGLLLAAIGIYGVTAYTVARRSREIGIRIALGARQRDIVAMVLGQGLWIAGIGSVIGLGLAALAGQALAGYLFGIPPIDPPTFIGALVLLVSIAVVASYIPARRAMRVDPLMALRHE